jgi:hypothetical protein
LFNAIRSKVTQRFTMGRSFSALPLEGAVAKPGFQPFAWVTQGMRQMDLIGVTRD